MSNLQYPHKKYLKTVNNNNLITLALFYVLVVDLFVC